METVRLMRSLEGKSRQQEGLPSGAVRKWKQGWDPKGPRSWKVTLERWETGWGGGTGQARRVQAGVRGSEPRTC